MEKLEALEIIKETWECEVLSLEEKINKISESFFSVGLDIATTANFIKATPAEFDAFLALSYLDVEMISEISKVNPPKTTWPLLASGNDDEIRKALSALSGQSRLNNESISEFIYQQMIEVAGDTPEKSISQLSGDELFYLAKKGKSFSVDDKNIKFLNSVAGQKKRGKALSDKQIAVVIDILNNFADSKVIQRDSIDGDKELCDRVLDALDR
jgi:hypothetical protein